jgi:hypothetical protein
LALPVTVKLIRISKDILIPNSLTSFNKKKTPAIQGGRAVRGTSKETFICDATGRLSQKCRTRAGPAAKRRQTSTAIPRRSAVFNFGREPGQTVALARL